MLDKRSVDLMGTLFNGVVGGTMGIDRLVTEIKDDMVRSVSNRLAYLLILSNADYAVLQAKEQGAALLERLLLSLLSSRW